MVVAKRYPQNMHHVAVPSVSPGTFLVFFSNTHLEAKKQAADHLFNTHGIYHLVPLNQINCALFDRFKVFLE